MDNEINTTFFFSTALYTPHSYWLHAICLYFLFSPLSWYLAVFFPWIFAVLLPCLHFSLLEWPPTTPVYSSARIVNVFSSGRWKLWGFWEFDLVVRRLILNPVFVLFLIWFLSLVPRTSFLLINCLNKSIRRKNLSYNRRGELNIP